VNRRLRHAGLAVGAVALVAVAIIDDADDESVGGGTPCGLDLALAITTGWDLPAVWIVDGEGERPLVPEEVTLAASFSPDGSEVVLVRAIGDYASAGPDATELWIVPTDGGERRLLLESDSVMRSPDWSPDGATIAYVDNPNLGYPELRSVAADGSGQPTTVLALDEVSVYEPAWSPDGGSIAYVTGEGDVGVVSRDGQHADTVVNVPWASSVDWSPDGTRLLVGTHSSMEDGTLVLVDVQRGTAREVSDQASAASWASDGSVYHFQRTSDPDEVQADWRLARSTFDGDDLVLDRVLDVLANSDDGTGAHPYIPVDTTCPD
jgi:TolB protein